MSKTIEVCRTLTLDKLPKSKGGVRYKCDDFNIYVPQDILQRMTDSDIPRDFPASIVLTLEVGNE